MAQSVQKTNIIVHIDMNAFYCACHAAQSPELYKGKPTAVAGNPETRHGILVTANYEARARGVQATMTVAQALRCCPSLILIPPDFKLYRTYSNRVFVIVNNFTPAVEIVSIDECFADLTGSSQFGSPFEIANQIQLRILHELGLPCSIGISANRFLAKMASDLKKPLGITSIWPDQIPDLLWPLPIETMFGVGKQTAGRLRNLRIQSIGDLAHYDINKLVHSFGARGKSLVEHANGMDDTPVNAENNQPKSIGRSITLGHDTANLEEIRITLLNLADQVGRRVREHGFVGRTISVTIRFNHMKTITRTHTLRSGTNLTEDIYEHAKTLVFENLHRHQQIRLLGVTLGQLSKKTTVSSQHVIQTSLFGDTPRIENTGDEQKVKRLHKLTEVTDRLRNRFGEDIVIRGSMMRPYSTKFNDER